MKLLLYRIASASLPGSNKSDAREHTRGLRCPKNRKVFDKSSIARALVKIVVAFLRAISPLNFFRVLFCTVCCRRRCVAPSPLRPVRRDRETVYLEGAIDGCVFVCNPPPHPPRHNSMISRNDVQGTTPASGCTRWTSTRRSGR